MRRRLAGIFAVLSVLVAPAIARPAPPHEDAAPVAPASSGSRTARIDALLAGFSSAAGDAWRAGSRALDDAVGHGGLTAAEVISLLHASVHLAPLDDRHDAQIQVVSALRNVAPDEAYVPVIEAIIPRLRPDARASAFALLLRQRSGVDALVRVARRDATLALLGLDRLGSASVPTTPVQRDQLLALSHDPVLVDGIAKIALDWTMRAVVEPAALAPRGADFIRGYRAARTKLAAIRGAHREDKDDVANVVGIYLDLLGRLPSAAVAKDLDAAATDPDPTIAVFAITSIVRGGRTPRPAVLARVVRDDHARWIMLQLLSAAEQQALIPAKWRTQEAMARLDLSNWLAFPTELDAWPDEIELMKVVPIDADDGAILDMYVFRFRMKAPHFAAKHGWQAGVAGPYLRGAPPTLGGANTFSSFEPADSRTAEEHAGRVEDILAAWRAAHGR